jgi:hypothetical protein
MSYFHTGIRTIIGAESFHCPVRDGKEWDQLAMVIRLKTLPVPGLSLAQSIRRVDFISALLKAYLDCASQRIAQSLGIHRYNVLVFKQS